ncbi:nitrite/sulfite reductase [Telmatobacter bradus]|uniref:nitrite/sulfite reductase n=1 Tax=Telmatobacter bradus TaxID=474953 RepID=UPI003B430E79
MSESPIVKETKAQRAERLKREKNPWLALDEVLAFARQGRSSVTPEWAGNYFKWWGIYTQGDGRGITGGKGGEGLTSDYFMMRVGLPNGVVTAEQLRILGVISQKYGRNTADITVRQAIQFHWLEVESLPEILETLDKAGLSPKGACGDVVRNVTGCPLAGVDRHELLDAAPVADAITQLLKGNSEFYNLPRKFKIAVTGCPDWCCHPEINDLALTPATRDGKVGFSLRVGGGLSNQPHLAVKLDAFVLPEQAVAVAKGLAEIFREQQVLRESREKARMKFLFLKEGWTAEKFLAELQAKLDFQLLSAGEETVPDEIARDHAGVRPQRQAGLNSVGISVLNGRLNGALLESLAGLAERYGSGRLRTTISQNIILLDIPSEKTSELVQKLSEIGLKVDGSFFWRGAVACTGTEFCKLAITETKGFARWVVGELEERLPEFDQQLKLNVTGCSNGCGQHWVADIGLEGKKVKQDGQMVDAYYFCLGGAVGSNAGIARPVGFRTPSVLVPEAIERLLRHYLDGRTAGESLRGWFARHSNEELLAQLAGEAVEPVERDKPQGHVPQGVAE